MNQADVDAQVERILASPLFAQSARLNAFLRFVVKTSQSGGVDSLKEYSLGVEVFERGADFDPRIDNIVRIQAAKLRSRLIEYYAGEGARDAIVISIPKGSYAPEIRARTPLATKAANEDTRSRIVVLPFVNMSSDVENEYFSDGLTEELINRLACVPELQVVARTSAFSFKGRNEDLRTVGAKLNVSTVLEGSVRRAGGQLRVTAQLIDVESGFHLFSRTYQREYKDVFNLQDELALAVALEVAPQSGRANLIQETRTEDLTAYNAYLRGMYAMGSEFVDLRQCVDFFREAIRCSPEYPAAWAGLSHGYLLLTWFYRAPDHAIMPLAREAALKALALDPESAMGLTSMASVECALDWRWAEGEEKFLRAIELQPSLSVSYVAYAFWCLLPQLRLDEAQDVIKRGLALDPFNPLMHTIAIYIFGRAREFEKAEQQGALGMNIAPQYAPIPACIGCAHEWSGQVERAIPEYREASKLALNAGFPYSCLAHALAVTGQTAEARSILNDLLQAQPQSPADIGRAYLGLGEDDEAVRWLQLAAERRSIYLLRVPGDARFDRLLTHPGYQAVLRGMGLPLSAAVSAGGG